MFATQPSSIDVVCAAPSGRRQRAPDATRCVAGSLAARFAERTKVELIVSEKRSSGWSSAGESRRREGRQYVSPRAVHIPAAVQRRIERGARYQELLARLLELSAQLQATLTHEQRALWLRLEDVLFDYAQVMTEAHYLAGQKHPDHDPGGARDGGSGMRRRSE
jgi:hypothetical protein